MTDPKKNDGATQSVPVIAVRGMNLPTPDGKGELRIEPGETLPTGLNPAIVDALIAEGSAKR